MILNRAKDYYENYEERLRGQVRDKYRNLSEEEKKKKREYGENRCHKMSEEKKHWWNIKKIIAGLKGINIATNKIVFKLWFDTVGYVFSHALLNLYICVIFDRLQN